MKKIISIILTIVLSLPTQIAFSQCPDNNHPHYIDLGLPSGKGWACCNVCATSPEDFGGFFAYGEYWEKASYMKENYTYYENLGYGYSIWTNIGTRTDISGSAGYDVAYKVMGKDWRMPTKAECQELVDSCTWEWTSIYGNNGYKVIGPNGKYIFLPAAGFKSSTNHNKSGERGIYRSSMWTMINGEASTSYAIDFTKDGVQVNNLGYRANGQTVRPISSASLNCFVNSSFLEEQKGKVANGFTADGKSEIAITYKDKNTILDEKVDLKFYLEGQEVNETVAGTVKEIQYIRDSIAIILTAPNDFLVSQGAEYKIRVELIPYHGGKPLTKVFINYRVLRPAVIFIHGLGDNNSCFQNMISNLIDKGLYLKNTKNKRNDIVSPQLLPVDYQGSNTSPFSINVKQNAVVKGACESICKNLFESDSIVSSKFDMVGHSMGGILARLYVQDTENGKESTHKIITLNTPHYGSPIGNIVSKFVPLLEKSAQSPKSAEFFSRIPFTNSFLSGDLSKGAINDLAINSDEIKKLNSESVAKLYGIPVYAVGTHMFNTSSFTIPRIIAIESINFMFHLFKKDVSANFWSSFFDLGVKSDGVVSVESQIGGISGYNSIYTGELNNAYHVFSPKWNIPQEEITRLLLAASTKTNFCMTGFKPYKTGTRSQVGRKANGSDSEYIADFEEPKPYSYMKITVEHKENEEYTHEIRLSHSDDMATIMAFAILSEDKMIADYDKECMYFDLKDYEGKVTFYSIGRTNYNALLLDSVVVSLDEDPTRIKSMCNDNNKVMISYSFDSVIVSLPFKHNNLKWQLYSLDGSLICNGQSKNNKIILKRGKSGIYILRITDEGCVINYKIMLK